MLCSCVCVGVIVCPSVSVSLVIHHDPSAWLGSTEAAGGDPQWSAVVLYLLLFSPLLLSSSLACWAAELILRRPGSVGCLPHSLCPCWPDSPGTSRWWARRRAEPQNGWGVSRREQALPSPPPPLPPTNRKSAAGFHSDGAGLVGWTGRQGRDRGKSRFHRGSQPSAPTCGHTHTHTFQGTEASGLGIVLRTSASAQGHRDTDRGAIIDRQRSSHGKGQD